MTYVLGQEIRFPAKLLQHTKVVLSGFVIRGAAINLKLRHINLIAY